MRTRIPSTLFSTLPTSNFHYDPDTGIVTNTKTGYVYTRIRKDGYLQIKLSNGKMVLAHRLAWWLHTKTEPDHIDHISGIRHDNRFCNLRNLTFRQNLFNKPKASNSNGMVGTTFCKSLNPIWRSQAISVLTNKDVDLGYYKTQYDAHLVRTLYMQLNYGGIYCGRDLDPILNGVSHPYFDGTLYNVVKSIKCNSGFSGVDYMNR